MSADDFARAREALVGLKLNGQNLVIASNWLSRWHNGKPPKMASFTIEATQGCAVALMICEIKKGQSLHCIKGGAILRVALGFDITNQDLLSLTPVAERDTRLDYWWRVVEGAVSVTYRKFTSSEGRAGFAQGVACPFADETPDGSRFFFMHTNWRPAGDDWIDGNVAVDFQTTSERRLISYREPIPQAVEQQVDLTAPRN